MLVFDECDEAFAALKVQLGADDRGEFTLGRRFRKANSAVEAVAVGQRKRGKTGSTSSLNEFLRMRAAFEKREIGMSVKFRVH